MQEAGEEGSLSEGVKAAWVDITAQFLDGAAQLQTGQLAHTSTFTAFEGISALEMMDKKMDAGVAYASDPLRILSVNDALRRGLLKTNNFTLPELLGIMDEVLAAETTWMDGQGLPQTVYTCMYVHRPTVIEDRLLYAFIIGVVKTINLVHGLVMRADATHEEDFQLRMCNVQSGGQDVQVSHMRAVGMLKDAAEEAHTMLNQCPADDTEQRCMLEGLKHRLEYRCSLLQALLALDSPMCQQLPNADSHLASVQTHLQEVLPSLSMGLQPEIGQAHLIGFERSLNYRQLLPAPAAMVELMSRQKAAEYLIKLAGQLRQLCVLKATMTVQELQIFMDDYVRQQPFVVARTVMNVLYWHGRKWFGTVSMAERVKQDIHAFIRPPYLEPGFAAAAAVKGSKEHQVQIDVDYFMHRVVKVVLEYLQIFCFNRPRQHRRLVKHMEQLEMLQHDAELLDNKIHENLSGTEWALPSPDSESVFVHYLGTWVLCRKLDAMLRYLLYGFELALYGPHELTMVYWYLDSIYGWLISADIRVARHGAFMEEHWANKNKPKSKSSKKKGAKPKPKEQPERGPGTMLLEVRQAVARGLYRTVEALEMEDRLRRPELFFDSELVRFDRRFEPFFRLDSPLPLEYAQFKTQADFSKYPAKTVYQGAWDCLMVSKTHLERMAQQFPSLPQHMAQERASLERVCKVNMVVLKLIMAGHRPNDKPHFEYNAHPAFLTLAFK